MSQQLKSNTMQENFNKDFKEYLFELLDIEDDFRISEKPNRNTLQTSLATSVDSKVFRI